MEALETSKEFLGQFTQLQIAVAAAVFVFLIIGLRLVLKKPPAHLTAFNGEVGSVLVSRKALQDLIRTACLLDKSVEAARPVIQVKSQKITARIELRLANPENLKTVCERVQDQVTSLLKKSLNFDQIGSIQIVVKSFSSESSKHPKPLPAEPTLLDSASTLSVEKDLPPPAARIEPSKPKSE